MISFVHKYIIKNYTATAAVASLKSTHLCFLNSTQRYLSENVSSRITTIKGLFENYGFTETQISKMLKYPFMLSLNLDIVKSKLDYFQSYGFTPNDLGYILTGDAHVIRSGLENSIIQSCEILNGLLKDNKSVIGVVKRSTRVLKQDLSKSLLPNIELLRQDGVPEYRILTILKDQPRSLLIGTDKFKIWVEEIKEMGFDPRKCHFAGAIYTWSGFSKETRNRKWDLYKKWGWSDDDILLAFRKQPAIMMTSEEKIERVMDFLVNKMGWDASQVSSCPLAVRHSLESWTMPRCLVVQFLLSKGVLKENLTLKSFILLKGGKFRERYVDRFCVEFPQVLNLYGITEDNGLNLQLKFLPRQKNSSTSYAVQKKKQEVPVPIS